MSLPNPVGNNSQSFATRCQNAAPLVYILSNNTQMSPNQPNPIDKQKSTANGIVSWSKSFLTVAYRIALLLLIVLALRPPQLYIATAMIDRPNPQIGPKSAPITIVEFGDYGCSSCLIWAAAGMRQQLLDKYGDKVRFVWADFPVVTLDSPKAAEAGRCAYDQGKFWEYQDYLYNNYQGLQIFDLRFYAYSIGSSDV